MQLLESKQIFQFALLLAALLANIIVEAAQKPKLYDKHIKFINFYFPTNPHVQKMYKNGYKGGYGKKYKDYHRGVIKNFKYPFRQHVSATALILNQR